MLAILAKLVGRFYGPISRIQKNPSSGFPKNELLPCKGLLPLTFYLIFAQPSPAQPSLFLGHLKNLKRISQGLREDPRWGEFQLPKFFCHFFVTKYLYARCTNYSSIFHVILVQCYKRCTCQGIILQNCCNNCSQSQQFSKTPYRNNGIGVYRISYGHGSK